MDEVAERTEDNNVSLIGGIEERIAILEQKLEESGTIESSQIFKADKLQTKLNSWVDTVEKQVKQIEKKLSRKIKILEEK